MGETFQVEKENFLGEGSFPCSFLAGIPCFLLCVKNALVPGICICHMNLIYYFCVRVICEDILPNLSKEQGGE